VAQVVLVVVAQVLTLTQVMALMLRAILAVVAVAKVAKLVVKVVMAVLVLSSLDILVRKKDLAVQFFHLVGLHTTGLLAAVHIQVKQWHTLQN
jgi:hypothetical protein